MIQVNIHEAKTHFSRLIKKVINGEEVIIAKGNKPVAKLVHFPQTEPKRKIGSAKGEIVMSPDFNDELDDFRDYSG